MRVPRPLRSVAVAGVLGAVVLTGCAEERPEVPVPASSLTPTPEPTSPVAATPEPSAPTTVPEFCDQVASIGQVVGALGVPIPRVVDRLYNDDVLPQSGRTGQLRCTYGAEGSAADEPDPVVITLASYDTPEAARARLDLIVADASGSVAETTLAGREALLFTGGETNSYAVIDGQVTLVVAIRTNLLPGPARRVVLTELAAIALGLNAPEGTEQ